MISATLKWFRKSKCGKNVNDWWIWGKCMQMVFCTLFATLLCIWNSRWCLNLPSCHVVPWAHNIPTSAISGNPPGYHLCPRYFTMSHLIFTTLQWGNYFCCSFTDKKNGGLERLNMLDKMTTQSRFTHIHNPTSMSKVYFPHPVFVGLGHWI